VLFGAGVGVPSNLEVCVERRYFSRLHYLALSLADDVLIDRLQQRPAWRGTHSPDLQSEHVRFNRWFMDEASKPDAVIELIDTVQYSLQETSQQVAAWIRAKL
jgi:hypothetical protein